MPYIPHKLSFDEKKLLWRFHYFKRFPLNALLAFKIRGAFSFETFESKVITQELQALLWKASIWKHWQHVEMQAHSN